MPNLTTYTLEFCSGLHRGTRGVNLEEAGVHLPADTLFAALVQAWRHCGGDAEAFGAGFEPEPPFLLTSGFPYAGGVRFFPVPVDLSRFFSRELLNARRKEIKRIRYLSEGLLRKLLNNELLDAQLFPENEYEEPQRGVALQGGVLWLLYDECAALPKALRPEPGKFYALRRRAVWRSQRVPRVTVHRISSVSTIFYAGRALFAQECGLWFGIEWRRPGQMVGDSTVSYQEAVKKAFLFLRDEGIGGERTTGYGHFRGDWGECEHLALPDSVLGQPALLLSRYNPQPSEVAVALTNSASAYTLEAVSSWLYSPDNAAQRRKRVHLLAEGSIICLPTLPAGRIVDIRPTYPESNTKFPHPIYRYGLALTAGFAAKGAVHA